MRWAWQSTALAVTVAFVVHGLFVPSAGAGTRTDREEAWLKGPVQMVRTATVRTDYDRSGHKTKEVYGPKEIYGNPTVSPYDSTPHEILYFYDARGRRTETVTYNSQGKLLSKTTHTYLYDAQGKPTEMVSSPVPSAADLSTRVVYTYDAHGHLTGEETYTDQEVRLESRRYDAQGRLVEWVIDQGGIRQTYTYDTQGNCVETETEAHEPGLGIGGEISTYDAQGTLLTHITYYIPKEGEGLEEGSQKVPPPSTDLFAYEWDTHGNWVKQVVTTCSGEPAAAGDIGTYTCKPASVTSRTITYYDEGHADK